MDLSYINALKLGGFNYDNCIRNKALIESGGISADKIQYTKTGTTICGAVFKDGVVLAADTRSTAGTVVADKNCEKIHYMAPNIYCSGAGTAADCEHITQKISRELELARLNSHCQSRVQQCVAKLDDLTFRYQGHLGTHLIIGGFDVKGPQLIQVSNNGYSFAFPFQTMGSGSLAAMAVMESQYREDMSEEEAKQLCINAIEAGIYHDLGSGSNVDICVIKKDKATMYRNIKHDNKKVFSKPGGFKFPKDSVKVLKEYNHLISVQDGEQPMDLS